ncbi:MAG TPA: hypothetical protein VN368_00645 [Candidatus Methylomirabilis sp.]|nr:hypothetical protein [Candidatus Methylomirabilis sp.]
MNEKIRIGIFIAFGCLIFAVSILSSIKLTNNLYNPEYCNSCHEMQTYYSTFKNPKNGSIILDHELKCIQCHSGRNIYSAKQQLLIEIITYDLNLPGNFSKKDLKPDCVKCHIPESPVHSNLNKYTCIDCHWAHTQNASYNTTNRSIPSLGPHMEKKCQDCHGMDFEIPRCIKCHAGHGDQKLDNNQCLSCHSDPHVPRIPGKLKNNTVTFKGNLSFSVCKPCHEDQYSNLTNIPTLHTEMETCTKCHQWHGEIPKCEKCHRGMMISRHPKSFTCKTCHVTFRGNLTTCQDCHGRTHEWSAFTAVLNPK